MRHQLQFPLVEQLFILARFAHSSSCSGVKGFQYTGFSKEALDLLSLKMSLHTEKHNHLTQNGGW